MRPTREIIVLEELDESELTEEEKKADNVQRLMDKIDGLLKDIMGAEETEQ